MAVTKNRKFLDGWHKTALCETWISSNFSYLGHN